jgi:hypothetical protein
LIAFERNERRFWAALKATGLRDSSLVIPAPVLAQCWRNSRQAQLARLVKAAEVVPLDHASARATGELCGVTGTHDIVDTAVAVLAAELRADVATSDPGDILPLLRAAGGRGRVLPL